MRLNDDFSQPVIVHAAALGWVPSPAPGVERRMLFRIGGEVARATSIVRYAPGSVFPRHVHGGGEEILVVDGVFQDEHGDYPAGSYFRNPPGTSHIPASRAGCTIFVRLWQFRALDQAPIVRQPGEGEALPARPGVTRATRLFADGHEEVRMETLAPGAAVTLGDARGLELLVLSGALRIGGETLERLSWGRFPPGQPVTALAGPDGATLWSKQAPPLHQDACPLPG